MGAIHKLLYDFGFTQFGVRLLAELEPGSPEWFEFVDKLGEGKDLESRSLALDQLKDEGLYGGLDEPSQARARNLAMNYLKKGVADEKRTALGFFATNRGSFSKDDADVFSAVYAASQSTDRQVATLAEELLTGWGWDRDAIKSDKDLR